MTPEALARNAWGKWKQAHPTWGLAEFDELASPEKIMVTFLAKDIKRQVHGVILNMEDVADHNPGCFIIRKLRGVRC